MQRHRFRMGGRRRDQSPVARETQGRMLVTSYGGIWWTSGSVPVAHLWGEVDAANAADVFRLVREGAGFSEVVIDFSDVVFMGSNVLGELLALTTEAPVWVVAPPGFQPRRLLEITGLTATIPTFDTIDAALNAQ